MNFEFRLRLLRLYEARNDNLGAHQRPFLNSGRIPRRSPFLRKERFPVHEHRRQRPAHTAHVLRLDGYRELGGSRATEPLDFPFFFKYIYRRNQLDRLPLGRSA